MAYRPITRETYEKLLQAYREFPGNGRNAGRVAGCTAGMARKGWEFGWSPRVPWARPIHTVLKEEQQAARAEQRRQELAARDAAQEERDMARKDAVRALAQEGQMLAAGRANVLAILASATQVLPGVRKLMADLLVDIQSGVISTPAQRMSMFRNFSLGIKYLVEATDRLVEGERRSKGEPTSVIGLEVDGTMTLEEAQREVEEVSALFKLAQERGLIGKPGAVVGPGEGEEVH
jgi:hypothetical protein